MVPSVLPLLAAADADELARGTTIAIVALLVLVLGLGLGAFIVLFRRGDNRGHEHVASQAALDSKAAALLVSLDDRVRDSEHEIGFAIAQFGLASVEDFATALAEARRQLTEAFRLGQQRDTSASDADQLRRHNTLQMIALCEKALSSLDRFDSTFAERRRSEADAGQTAQELHTRIGVLRVQAAKMQQDCSSAAERYVEAVLTTIRRQLILVESQLDQAEHELDTASAKISPTGVNAVAEGLQAAATHAHKANRELAASELALSELGEAERAVEQMRESSVADLKEARVASELAPDPSTGAHIVAAIAAVDAALVATVVLPGRQIDPFRQLALLTEASADVDAALATARNQQQRFEHARAAYQGTLIAARSQIAVVKELVERGGASASARTRLAEAERQLMIAEAETDPVEALDAVRRSVNHARDADALALY